MLSRFRALERWQRTLLIIFLVQLFSAVGFSIVSPFMPLYVAELGSSTGLSVEFLSGMVISAQAFTMMLTAPVWGALADRMGRKLMVARATFGGAAILLLMAFVTSAEQLVLVRALQGLVTGTVAAANALVAGEAPRERTGFAIGIVQVGLWSGVALGPLIGGLLADAYGFRIPFVVTAVLLFISGLLVWYGVREQFAPTVTVGPERMGFIAEWRHVFTLEGVPPTFVTRFLTGVGRNLVTPILPLFIATLMTSESGVSGMTGLITGVASVMGTLGALVLGRVGDRIGHRPVLIGSALGVMVFSLPQAIVTAPWQLLILQVFIGLASGGIVSAPSALLAQYTPYGEEGAVYGLDNSVWSGARSVAPLMGSAVAVWLGMRSTFIITGGIFGLAALLAYLLLPSRVRHRLEAEETESETACAAAD
jgi:DHA1 family multidrug resistance protein-like MFS transporter